MLKGQLKDGLFIFSHTTSQLCQYNLHSLVDFLLNAHTLARLQPFIVFLCVSQPGKDEKRKRGEPENAICSSFRLTYGADMSLYSVI